MHESAISDEADSLYRPLDALAGWEGAMVDEEAWTTAVGRLEDFRRHHPAWADMVLRGARLASAHQSGALDRVHGGGAEIAMALVRGEVPGTVVGAEAWPHVRANDAALGVADAAPAVTEEVLRQVHEIACGPQLSHRVHVDGHVQDHVFAHGEYKHHPNHVPVAGGGWRARAPVSQAPVEMHRLLDGLVGAAFASRHPAVRAAYVLNGVSHVAPFADGNGRVARALAGAVLLRAAGIPLLILAEDSEVYDDALVAAGEGDAGDLVRLVFQRGIDLAASISVRQVPPAGSHVPAFDRWRGQVAVARSIADALPTAMAQALARHRARTDLGWLSSLAGAKILPPGPSSHEERFDAGPLVVVAPLPGGPAVKEVIAIDAHPLDADSTDVGSVVLRAQGAQVRLEVDVSEPVEASSTRLGTWLDRVVSTLALRVAAESE